MHTDFLIILIILDDKQGFLGQGTTLTLNFTLSKFLIQYHIVLMMLCFSMGTRQITVVLSLISSVLTNLMFKINLMYIGGKNSDRSLVA